MINPEEQFNQSNNDYNSLSQMPPFEQWRSEQAKQTEQAEVDPEKQELFNKFVDFFKKDSSIKHTLTELAPNEQDFYGDGATEYADKLYEGTRDTISDIKSIMRNFYPSETLEERFKQIEADVINAGANPQKLTSVYQKDFASMSKEFNDGVRQEVSGYYLHSNPHQFDAKVTSVNEALHLIHSSIVNDEKLLQSLPVLDNAEDHYDRTTLYGLPASTNPVAKEIFDQIKNGDESLTDIVSLPDRTLMMVRDRGHALTIDIEKDAKDDRFYVNYFIPKICNVDKINMLPGVRRVAKKEGEQQAREFTTGVFDVENEADVASAVTDFVKMVPTDHDIDIFQHLKNSA